ncbi:MAG: hypothetical protein KF893_04050 [Caldilineaceae bacterium]|nr:hypothetical protein [Caldilineaceae bacterium]
MDTLTVDVKEAEMQLSKLLTLALQGKTVIIAENQESVVQLVPIRKRPPATDGWPASRRNAHTRRFQ